MIIQWHLLARSFLHNLKSYRPYHLRLVCRKRLYIRCNMYKIHSQRHILYELEDHCNYLILLKTENHIKTFPLIAMWHQSVHNLEGRSSCYFMVQMMMLHIHQGLQKSHLRSLWGSGVSLRFNLMRQLCSLGSHQGMRLAYELQCILQHHARKRLMIKELLWQASLSKNCKSGGNA